QIRIGGTVAGGRLWRRVVEICGAHEAIGADTFGSLEVMEHQNALTEARCADLEAGAAAGERVEAEVPLAGVERLRRIGGVLTVVEYHLEHPQAGSDLGVDRLVI